MRPDLNFLNDIAHNAALLIRFVADIDRETFHQDEMRQMAVERGLGRRR